MMEKKAEEFLLDESFVRYCLQTDEEAIRYWEKWQAEHPDQTIEIRRAKELYFILNGNLTERNLQKDRQEFQEVFESHLATTAHAGQLSSVNSPAGNNIFRMRKWLTGAAAAAAVTALIWLVSPRSKWLGDSSKITTGFMQESKPGERKSFQLPDGTEVTLNAGSTLNVSADFNLADRKVILHGEAFFEVSHDKTRPFIIHTDYMDVKVLGTVFNVKAYDSDVQTETSLISGSVEITLNKEGNRKVLLHPNEKIVLLKKESNTATVSSGYIQNSTKTAFYKVAPLTHIPADSSLKEISWLENRLSFDQEQFGDIAMQLERWYDVKVVFKDQPVKEFRYTGTFEKKTLQQILEALQISKHFTYQITKDKQIIINE